MSITVATHSYGNGEEDLLAGFLSTSDTEQMLKYAGKVSQMGKVGIPIFLDVLSKSLDNSFVLSNYGKSNICIKSLHTLAEKNIFIAEEIPVLIKALHKLAHIEDTYLVAETLRIVTGIDTGYSKNFVSYYTTADEKLRKEKIVKWETWWNKKKKIYNK